MTKMNVRLAALVIGMTIFGLLLVACGDNTSTTAPATTAAATTAATSATTAASTTAATTTSAATTAVNPVATATPLPATTSAATTAPATTAAATTAAPTTAAATTAAPTTAPATTSAATTAASTTAAATTASGVKTAPASGGAAPTTSGTAADTNKDLFLDDRSNALQVLRSFYNAINRKEYVRAYSYYASGTKNFPAYADFAKGYADTATVELFTGQITSGVGAGNVYYGVPFSIKSTNTSGAATVFAGCYTVHGVNDPKVFGAPPYTSINIDSAKVQQVQAGGDTAGIMASSCQDTGSGAVTITANPNDDTAVDAKYFVDDRSTPEAIIRSFYNAINRKEYVRAYSYFVTQGAQTPPPAYADFAAGYKNTDTVQLTLSTPTSDAGAGNINYSVPVKLTVKNSDGSTQNFSGTYTLHKAQPANFGQPPFEPLGISGASIK